MDSMRMDRTVVRKTTLAGQDEAYCLSMSVHDRILLLEDMNRRARAMMGYAEGRLNRSIASFR